MADRPSWPRIRLGWLNVVCYSALLLLCALYWGELRWAAAELPNYLSGRIGSPVERQLYREASRIIASRGDLERARGLLERSLAIDPTCEAGFWLAEYRFAVGRHDEALEQYLVPAMRRRYAGAASP